MIKPLFIVLGAGAVVALAMTVTPRRPLLIYNASASAPVGFYALTPEAQLHRGELVLASIPIWARKFAAERHYLPLNVPVVKRIAALSGDKICADADAVSINGRTRAIRLKADSVDRPLPIWTGCKQLGPRDVLLLMPHKDSFDGRYFGPVSASQISGKLVALWTR
jgi:conjugative transfer signal peptidase TraF